MPKEHGAYGQFGMPLLTAVIVTRGALGAWAMLLSALAVFMLHEPLLVLLGRRGTRAKRELGPVAQRALVIGVFLAGGLFALAVAFGKPLGASLLGPVALAVPVLVLVLRNQEKTVLGEVLVATALSSCALPTVRAGGGTAHEAWVIAGTWAAAYGVATIAVHALLPKYTTRRRFILRGATLACCAVLGGLAAWGAVAGRIAPFEALATGPVALLAVALAIAPVATRHLRRVGWLLVLASFGTMALLIAG